MFDAFLGLATPSAADNGWATKDPWDDYWYLPRGQVSNAGVDVTEETALALAAVYACVAKLSKTMATLPVVVVEKTGPNEREPIDHPLADLLSYRANPEATGLTVRETLMANLLLWGNAYAECIFANDRKTLLALVPLQSRMVTPGRNVEGELVYEHLPPRGERRVLTQSQIWHIAGLSFNGITGLSPIAYARESIGLGLATAKFGSSFFGNGMWAGGWVKRAPDKETGNKPLSAEDGARLMAELNERLRGPDKAFSAFLLREGMEYHQITSMPLKDAQFVELRGMNRIDICGLFDVPPSKLHDLSEGTYNNTEQQDLAWVKDSILPWSIRFEVSAKAKFFLDQPYHLRHNLAGLLRGDSKTQMEAMVAGIMSGIYSVNECRQFLDLNPVKGGNQRLTPLNMGILGEPRSEAVQGTIALTDDTEAGRIDITAFAPLAEDIAARIAAKEIKAVSNAYQRRIVKGSDVDGFRAWLDKFYTEHADYVTRVVSPLWDVFQATTGVALELAAADLAESYTEEQYDTLYAMLDYPGGVEGLFDKWHESKARAIADGLVAILQAAGKHKEPDDGES